MRNVVTLFSIALLVAALPLEAAPGKGPGAQSGAGRPATSQDHYRRDGMHRQDSMNRTRRDAHERGSLHRADPETKGDDTAVTMRSRRDERKQIQGDYRTTREPGQEGTRNERDPQKKPWWKFWGR